MATRWLAWLIIILFILANIPTANAGTVSNRSINLSDDSKGATDVSYTVKFDAATDDTNAFVIDFCRNSSVITDDCSPVGGLDISALATSGGNTASLLATHTALIELGVTANASDTVEVELTGAINPYDSGVFYARIVTYQTALDAGSYVSGVPGSHLDDGAVAIPITDSVSIGGSVLETLEFCVSGSVIDSSGCDGSLTAPNLELGDQGRLGLSASTVSVYSELSTNAVGGAIVSLKSSSVGCGGLVRAGAREQCDIKPLVVAGDLVAGGGVFGLKIGAVDGGSGNVQLLGGYSATDYYLNYITGDAKGVTSFAGDAVFSSANAPISKGKVELKFGASAAPSTPAGSYRADLYLLATGRF